MIIKQELAVDGKDVRLRSTVDASDALSLVEDANKSGGERGRNIVCLGHIPIEMWAYDPWLVEANKARMAGDMYEYQKNVKKFFEVHPAFAIQNEKRYYQGGVSL